MRLKCSLRTLEKESSKGPSSAMIHLLEFPCESQLCTWMELSFVFFTTSAIWEAQRMGGLWAKPHSPQIFWTLGSFPPLLDLSVLNWK